MLVTLAGALSTAEIGVSLAEMIRRGAVHAVACTGANLEEDLFGFVGRGAYVPVPNYRTLTPAEELQLAQRGLCRITDVCVPVQSAITPVDTAMASLWRELDARGERCFPHELCYRLIREGLLRPGSSAAAQESWVAAAAERDLPIFVPGWEDSTLGNAYAARVLKGELASPTTARGGIEYLIALAEWYTRESANGPLGFFQIGGGTPGDFAICVVPMLNEDANRPVPLWDYFCQISDSTTSYGSYSGAPPGEKITWGKIRPDTPAFVIESDATIVFPLVAALVLGA
jgi:deoxyhypusine synthase